MINNSTKNKHKYIYTYIYIYIFGNSTWSNQTGLRDLNKNGA